ncbi:MAG: hypothetical protein M1824_001856 [Vezdaea acicularis]|nr:MAG: hypothetical protein M1824_001856 [Vezdaea acicularis]
MRNQVIIFTLLSILLTLINPAASLSCAEVIHRIGFGRADAFAAGQGWDIVDVRNTYVRFPKAGETSNQETRNVILDFQDTPESVAMILNSNRQTHSNLVWHRGDEDTWRLSAFIHQLYWNRQQSPFDIWNSVTFLIRKDHLSQVWPASTSFRAQQLPFAFGLRGVAAPADFTFAATIVVITALRTRISRVDERSFVAAENPDGLCTVIDFRRLNIEEFGDTQ